MITLLKTEKFQKIHTLSRCVFLCLFTFYLILREVTALDPYIDNLYVTALFLVGSTFFVGIDFLTNRYLFKTKYVTVAIVFLVFTIVSCIINVKYGFFSNLKGLAAFFIYLFLLYPEALKDNDNRNLYACFSTALFTISFFALISIPMYLFNICYIFSDGHTQGFSIDIMRLWGFFHDPNYVSLYIIICGFLSILLFKKTNSIIKRIFIVTANIINFIHFTLAGSRMGKLALILGIFWLLAVIFFKFIKTKIYVRIFGFLGASILSVLVIYGSITGIELGLPMVKKHILNTASYETYVNVHKLYDKLFENDYFEITSGLTSEAIQEDYKNNGIQKVERLDNHEDISNGRLTRWLDSIKIISKKPLFGTSPRNIFAFAKEFATETLMAQNDFYIHNTYLEILAGGGIIGATTILCFLILAAICVIKSTMVLPTNLKTAVCSSIVLIIAFSAFLLPDIIFFQTTFSGFTFWTVLGYCLNVDNEEYKNSWTNRLIKKCFKKGK